MREREREREKVQNDKGAGQHHRDAGGRVASGCDRHSRRDETEKERERESSGPSILLIGLTAAGKRPNQGWLGGTGSERTLEIAMRSVFSLRHEATLSKPNLGILKVKRSRRQ